VIHSHLTLLPQLSLLHCILWHTRHLWLVQMPGTLFLPFSFPIWLLQARSFSASGTHSCVTSVRLSPQPTLSRARHPSAPGFLYSWSHDSCWQVSYKNHHFTYSSVSWPRPWAMWKAPSKCLSNRQLVDGLFGKWKT
jgi:hypothetical protein